MTHARKEIEAKFNLSNFTNVRRILGTIDARPLGPRSLERNLRFDTDEGSLHSTHQILRLRAGMRKTLTYKRSSSAETRIEIEVEVADFEAAKAFLLALGYRVVFIYEKYRQSYETEHFLVALDELPFGRFVEVEGPAIGEIERLSKTLDLDWGARVKAGYMEIFKTIQRKRSLSFRDATFENWKDLPAASTEELSAS